MPVYMPAGTDSISEERFEEFAEKELELLFGRVGKGRLHSRYDLIGKVEKFVAI